MTDARHPKRYPSGPKHPKLEVNRKWKALVMAKLEQNRREGRVPGTPTALAEKVGAHKTGLLKMLAGPQETYKYARQICEVLGIGTATIDNPEIPEVSEDIISSTIERVRTLPAERQREALAALESFLRSLDDR